MSSNLEIWDTLAKTDPKQTKAFSRAGGFKGKSVKPIYVIQKMTEHFGPVGKGWGFASAPQFETAIDGDETLVFCTVALWHTSPECVMYGVGGEKVFTKRNSGQKFADDEAFKKAFTDAIGNALKLLGMSADIHMGQHDDDKYVTALRAEFADEKPPADKPADQPEDPSYWQQEWDELAAIMERLQALESLAEFWSTERVKAFMHGAPADLRTSLTAVKDLQKGLLTAKAAA